MIAQGGRSLSAASCLWRIRDTHRAEDGAQCSPPDVCNGAGGREDLGDAVGSVGMIDEHVERLPRID